MSRHISDILDVTKEFKRKWTMLIQVVEIGHEQYDKNRKKYKKLLFTDPKGTKVTGIIFENMIRNLQNTFKSFNKYYISNAFLTLTEERFRVSTYPYSWGLNSRTLIEGHPEMIPPALPCKFQFTPFNELHKYVESHDYQNVKGIVVSCLPSHEEYEGSGTTTRKDVVVVNEEKKLIILTLWDAFKDREGWTLEKMADTTPIIFDMRLIVITFHALSLTTRLSSTILINPPAAETQELQNCSRATIELDDGSGIIRSVISSPYFEKFNTLSPKQVRGTEEYDPHPYETIAKTIFSCLAVAFLRSYETTYNNQSTTRIVIVKAHKATTTTDHLPLELKQEAPTT
ncbi:hypothetical protein OSB04_011792 [Centaurea solstitialis]|uniref:Replication protein A OB domain-containing protein n=1 Tax=Centaurea solstitialis TaxID=347529 RepID=A0AA38THP5_9ASTR|nr:hypothetical protein OSB04_011792 [Centaurea solstitialis]